MESRVTSPTFLSRTLRHTTVAFQTWEKLNNKLARWGHKLLCKTGSWPAETEAQRLLRRRARTDAVLRAISPHPTLFELCLWQCMGPNATTASQEALKFLLVSDQDLVYLQRRRRAAGIIADFIQGCILSRRARADEACSQLLVRSTRRSTHNQHFAGSAPGDANAAPMTRIVWKPSKLPVKMLVRLVRVHGYTGLRLKRESRWEEVLHAAYCLWLINPIVLGLLASVFLTCDVALPFVMGKIYSILLKLSVHVTARSDKFLRHLTPDSPSSVSHFEER